MTLEKGMTLPSLRLKDVSGGELTLDPFRGRHNLVLFLPHPAGCPFCEMKLRELQEGYGEVAAEGGEILIVVPTLCKTDPHLPFPVLFDADRSLGEGAAIVIADRFGEIFHVARAEGKHDLPAVSEIVDWLAFVAVQCPE